MIMSSEVWFKQKYWIAFIRLLVYVHFVAFYLSVVFISNTILSNKVCKQPGKSKRYFTKLKERMVYINNVHILKVSSNNHQIIFCRLKENG